MRQNKPKPLSSSELAQLIQALKQHLRQTQFYQKFPQWPQEVVEFWLNSLTPPSSEQESSPEAQEIHLFVDGASRGNPGPAGIGIVLTDPEGNVLQQKSQYIGQTTNNIAEYRALLEGVQLALAFQPQQLRIFMDSELVVRQLQGAYRTRNVDLLKIQQQVRDLLAKIPQWIIAHVPRHLNKTADKLANIAINSHAGDQTERSKP